MDRYNPAHAPDPAQWIALGEQQRIRLVEAFHRAERHPPPNLTAHAAFHAIVENQLAEGLESVVRAMARLAQQGLSRHESIPAIGWILAQHLYELLHATAPNSPAEAPSRYDAAIERLDAATWRAQGTV